MSLYQSLASKQVLGSNSVSNGVLYTLGTCPFCADAKAVIRGSPQLQQRIYIVEDDQRKFPVGVKKVPTLMYGNEVFEGANALNKLRSLANLLK